jgi:hypothetical protein
VRRQSSRLRTLFQKRDESMRWPPSLAAGQRFSPQKKDSPGWYTSSVLWAIVRR